MWLVIWGQTVNLLVKLAFPAPQPPEQLRQQHPLLSDPEDSPVVVHKSRSAAAAAAGLSQNPPNQKPQLPKIPDEPHHRHGGDKEKVEEDEEHVDSGVHPDIHQDEQKTDDNSPLEKQNDGSSSSHRDGVLTKRGTGPARTGYVVDLVGERDRADFRHAMRLPTPVAMSLQTEKVMKLVQENGDGTNKVASLQPCEYSKQAKPKGLPHQHHSHPATVLLQQARCRDPDAVLYAYNNAPFPRYYCGQSILPGRAVALSQQHCGKEDVVHLFPPKAGSTLPGVTILAWDSNNGNSDLDRIATRKVTCDVPCQWEDSLKLPDPDPSKASVRSRGATNLMVRGTPWKIVHTMDDPYYHSDAKMERTSYRRNIYYSTISMLSSVPLTFYDADIYDMDHYSSSVDWSTAANKVTYLLNDECGAGRRNKWHAAVSAVMTTESYGSCHHNAEMTGSESLATLEGRLALMRKNRISLAMEAGTEKDYISPIVWESLLAGNVPAILGASNLEQRLPPHSAILASSFNSWDKFAAYMQQVANNQTLWESYHTWRTDKSALKKFKAQWEFTQTKPECRICRWAHAKQYGLGWNHSLQALQENHLARSLCSAQMTNADGKVQRQVTKPFREVWAEKAIAHDVVKTARRRLATGTPTESCTGSFTDDTIETKDYIIQRKIVEHDGVYDIALQLVEPKSKAAYSNDLVLRLEIDSVRNTDGAFFRDTHTLVSEGIRTAFISSASIQDDTVKVTVLANWVTQIHSPSEGRIEIVIHTKQSDEDEEADQRPRYIRVIVEDMTLLHDKMTEFFPSTFGRQMTQDFIDPLEFYYES